MAVTAKSLVLTLLLGASAILAQDSSSSNVFSIQTSPPEPTSSSSSSSSSGSGSQSGSSSSTGTGSGTTSAPATTASATTFPQDCTDQCMAISSALASCGAGDALNTTCLCTTTVEREYQTCLQCALGEDPTDAERTVYQAAMDAYINQCASAPLSPVTLPNVTITLPSTSASGSVSGSSSNSGGSASTTSSTLVSGSSSAIVLPSSSVSHPPTSSAASAASSATSSAAGGGGSNGAERRTRSEDGRTMMAVGLAGVLGAVIAAAAI
ncbi:hypothetical protein IAU59_000991 [Kwoniella sp. CBS 9459]